MGEQLEKNFLSDDNRKTLKKVHRKEEDKKPADRIKAILLLDQGYSYKEVAAILLRFTATDRACFKKNGIKNPGKSGFEQICRRD